MLLTSGRTYLIQGRGVTSSSAIEIEAAIPACVRAVLASLPEPAEHEAAAPMLPSACYTSREFFEFEREAVFARSWLCVGRADQLPNPGDHLAASAAGEPLLVVRGEDGTLRAMSAARF
jgi:hypothetical protein